MSLASLADQGPYVVALGGGHGLSKVLESVQQYAGKIAAVVTAADDGGSSGRIIGDIKIPPPGDIRRCLLALSSNPTVFGELFGHRFDSADVAGHSLGNLMLAAMAELTGDFEMAVRLAEDELGACGRVHPVARQALRLGARINGRHVIGQVAIAEQGGSIDALWAEPEDVRANPAAIAAIVEADQIILAPGSLYTSLLSTLVVPGIADAINAARGRLMYVSNITTQVNETEGMTGEDHLAAISKIGGIEREGTIVAHQGNVSIPEGLDLLTLPAGVIEVGHSLWDVITRNLVRDDGAWPAHDPLLLGRLLASL